MSCGNCQDCTCDKVALCAKCDNAIKTETDETRELSRKHGISVKMFAGCKLDPRIHNQETADLYCPVVHHEPKRD